MNVVYILVANLIASIGCFDIDGKFIENQNVFSEFFELDRVRFDITKNTIEIVFVNT